MPRSVSPGRVATLLGGAHHRSPAYRSVAETLRLLIDDGRIPSGTRLPSERALAESLDCSRTTITRAYALLADSGFAISRRGSGTEALQPPSSSRDGRGALIPGDGTTALTPGAQIDLTCAAMPAPAQMQAAYARASHTWPNYLSGSGYYPLGIPALREALAERFSRRGLPTSADEVMITSGAVGAHAMTARALLSTGVRLLVDSPTYPNGLTALRADGARPVAVPLDSRGWDLDSWNSSITHIGAKAALLVPDFHNPTGLLMSDAERSHLAHRLQRHGMLAIVDETLVDTSLTESPMPSPFAAHQAHTVTIGGASKSHWSGLRVGWVRAPAHLLSALAAARTTLDLGTPVMEQLALLELMEGEPEMVAERRRTTLERRNALVTLLSEELPEWQFRVPDGGFCLWATLPEAVSTPFVLAAESHDVLLAPGPRFAAEPGLERHLRIPFTAPIPVLREAVTRLATVWGSLDPRRHASRELSTPLIA